MISECILIFVLETISNSPHSAGVAASTWHPAFGHTYNVEGVIQPGTMGFELTICRLTRRTTRLVQIVKKQVRQEGVHHVQKCTTLSCKDAVAISVNDVCFQQMANSRMIRRYGRELRQRRLIKARACNVWAAYGAKLARK